MSSHSHDGDRRVYYSKARAAAFLSLAVLIAFFAVVAVAGAQGTGGKVAAIVLGCAGAAGFLRSAACAVIADGNGVTVRNPLRTYRIAYDQIAHVSTVGHIGVSAGTKSIVEIKLKDGSTVRPSALITYVSGTWRRRHGRYSDSVVTDLMARAHGGH